MCMMPFSKDTGEREDDNYCSLCYKNGELVYQGGDVNEFKQQTYEAMRNDGMGKCKAKFFTWMIGFAPYWKDKNNR